MLMEHMQHVRVSMLNGSRARLDSSAATSPTATFELLRDACGAVKRVSTLKGTSERKTHDGASACLRPSMRMVTETDLISDHCCHVPDLHATLTRLRRPNGGAPREREAWSRASGRHRVPDWGLGWRCHGSARARRDTSWLRMGDPLGLPMACKKEEQERRCSAMSPGRRRPIQTLSDGDVVRAGRRPCM